MLSKSYTRSKNEPLRIDVSNRGLPSEIRFHQSIALQQPQYTPAHAFEQAHPNVKECWRDLVGVVERAEDKGILWKSAFGARGDPLRNLPFAVVRLITVRKLDEPFAVEPLLALGRNVAVGEDIVHEISPHRAGITQVIHLNGCRPVRQ